MINIPLIKLFSQYTSVYDFKDDNLLKTTLGNTIIRYFNTNSIIINKNKNYSKVNISLDCGENFIDEFVAVRRYYNVQDNISYEGPSSNEFDVTRAKRVLYINYLNYNNRFLEIYNLSYGLRIKKCKYKNNCIFEIEDLFYDFEVPTEYNNMTDILYYSCITKINSVNEDSILQDFYLKYNISNITLEILFIIILFYLVYKKSISRDNKEYQKKNYLSIILH